MQRMFAFRIYVFACLGLVLLAVGCAGQRGGETAVLLGDTFTLGYGETAVIQTEDLQFTFDEVLEDSRCPTQVQCFWTGQARLVITARQGDAAPVSLEFNTNPAPNENLQTISFGEYRVDLQSIDPYPQEADKSIELADYRVTLQVNKP